MQSLQIRSRIKILSCCILLVSAFIAANFHSFSMRGTAHAETDGGQPTPVEKGPEPKAAPAADPVKASQLDPQTLRSRIYQSSRKKTSEDWALQDADSTGCQSCHNGIETTHTGPDGKLYSITNRKRPSKDVPDGDVGCVYCHGGNGDVMKPSGSVDGAPDYEQAEKQAHVQPSNPKVWQKNGKYSSANPERSYTALLQENIDFVRFINPGDLRVADIACGECHNKEAKKDSEALIVDKVKTSMMTHGGMLWGAALYNNGAYSRKDTRFGESYNSAGVAQTIMSHKQPRWSDMKYRNIRPFMTPLPKWEITQPGNVLRVFERGGRKQSEIGNINPEAEIAGLPENKLSPRGYGTIVRTDPVYLGLQKSRLLDPITSMLGTNEHPGDYRSSGCTACHTPYANDRSAIHSSDKFDYNFTNMGMSKTGDPTIPKNEPGHPIRHTITNAIPTSQCITCHMHPGTNMLTGYMGYMWWDNETDGENLYPKEPLKRTDEELENIRIRNPEGSAERGLWGDADFLPDMSKKVNPDAKRTQFADFHGHGWLFRAIFKQDRKGNMLDEDDKPITNVTSAMMKEAVDYTSDGVEVNKKSTRPGLPVHLKDIHLEKGMHCVDCHFTQDGHGDRNLYGEPRAAIEVSCQDCHGSIYAKADPKTLTTGFAGGARKQGLDKMDDFTSRNKTNKSEISDDDFTLFSYKVRTMLERNTLKAGAKPRKTPVLEIPKSGPYKDKVIQYSAVDPTKFWVVVQTVDTITPGNEHYNEKSHYAKTLLKGDQWDANAKPTEANDKNLAHSDARMTCYTCHSSWMTSCFGCHLPMVANQKRTNNHNEGGPETRNWTAYNFQVLRDDVFMLGVDGTATGNRIAPVRSSSAVLVGSKQGDRRFLYSQQQTVSAEGYSGQAFNTHVPHTVRGKETKGCVDCHISKENDNNAIMAQLLLQGTNYVNFLGRYVYVAEGEHHGFSGVAVTERTEPQAVIGSDLHAMAYPNEFKKHEKDGRELKESYEHHGTALSLQMRGEYLYVAEGKDGIRVYDIANVDNKDISERITTAPVSPLGQKFYVRTKYATAVASPSTLAVDPTRTHHPENEEQPIAPVYGYIYASDREEGLVMIFAPTLLDGDPNNNFLKKDITFNPNGILNGAENLTIAGNYAYVLCDRGDMVIVDLTDPKNAKVARVVPGFKKPKAVAIQFRYAFVTDEEGLKVVDVTMPEKATLLEKSTLPLHDAKGVYLARTYAYVASGHDGLVIVNIEKPESPTVDQKFTADGQITDAHDVKVGMTNASAYAYVADGKNGLRVIQLTSPKTMSNNFGFSPRPEPRLVATFKTKGEALAISKGLDRDRAVDESGNQTSVFGRRGARPFNLEEQRRLYMRADGTIYKVSNDVPKSGSARAANKPSATPAASEKSTVGAVAASASAFIGNLSSNITATRASFASLGLLAVVAIPLIVRRRRRK
jgi:hypothetical protein